MARCNADFFLRVVAVGTDVQVTVSWFEYVLVSDVMVGALGGAESETGTIKVNPFINFFSTMS